VLSLLFNFLIPLHVMAEVAGLSVSIRALQIPGDAADERHSAWTLGLTGASGATCTLNWCTLGNGVGRTCGSHIVYEHHYDYQQIGGPLTFGDLSFNGRSTSPSSKEAEVEEAN
jgi:hypothetical protein